MQRIYQVQEQKILTRNPTPFNTDDILFFLLSQNFQKELLGI